MNLNNRLWDYEVPQVEVIEVEVENGFAASGGTFEKPIQGEESGW